MSTTTTSTGNFNQLGMGAYNSMVPNFQNAVNGYMNSPFSNPFFQTQQQMGYRTADQQNQANMSNITRNLNLSGIQQNSPAALEMMNNQMRSGTANRANLGFLNPVQNAFTAQQNSMSMAGNFKPLQTGQTQSQGGLGSWLPQLLGGGLSLLTGGLLGGGNKGAPQSPQQVSNVWGSGAMTNMNAPTNAPSSFGTYGMGQGAPSDSGYNFASNPFMMGQPQAPQY